MRRSGRPRWSYGSAGESFEDSDFDKDPGILIPSSLSSARHTGKNGRAVYALLANRRVAFSFINEDMPRKYIVRM